MPGDIADPSLAKDGLARIEWADRNMPVLAQIRDRFEQTKPFDGLRIAVCMHVSAETANLVRTLAGGGAHVTLAASNPLSTQDEVAAALAEEYGATVFARAGVDVPTYRGHLAAALDGKPQLLLDDACDLVSTLHADRPELIDDVLGGCEQTTTGLLRLRAMATAGALRIPVLAVNDTGTKQLFDNTYGTGQSVLDAIFRSTNTLLAGRTVVVAGYGYCGRGVASRAQGMGANVVVTEVDPVRAIDATMNGFTVLPMAEAARVGDVFITVTGSCDVISDEHFAAMKDGSILVNAGHFDVEIDVRALEREATVRRRVRPHTDEYVLADGRRLLLVAEGRVANLAASEGHPPAVMDMAFADQALSAAWLVDHHAELTPGVYDVPKDVDDEVAQLRLDALGVRIDEQTGAQRRYQLSWEA